MRILKIDASTNRSSSTGRALGQHLVNGLSKQRAVTVVQRDADAKLPMLSEPLLHALAVEPSTRSSTQRALTALPETLIEELETTDALILTCPIYNFGIPAALKAWVDLVTRAGRTFRYTETGPVPLLRDRPVFLIVTSGGTGVDSEIDFATPYLRHVLGFIGLKDVRLFDAGRLMLDHEGQMEAVEKALNSAIDEFPMEAA